MARDMSELLNIFETIFEEQIRSSLVAGEKYTDVWNMIQLIAYARAERMGSSTIEHFIYGGSLICTIFEPLKLPGFVREARAFRLRFRGIAKDPEIAKEFRDTWTERLLESPNLESALEDGFDRLFRVERGMTLA